jgi:SAM-dependent methyltransferase
LSAPSSFFLAESARVAEAAARGPVVDLACGRGRHALAAAELGARVLGLDRNPALLQELRASARSRRLPLLPVRTDLETPRGIPVRSGSCGAILVFRFLFRPLAPRICEALARGGLLLYETFTIQQRDLGQKPSNKAFLLEEGELPELFGELQILSYWEGLSEGPRPEALARLVARKAGGRV